MQISLQYNVMLLVIFISILLIIFTCGRLLLGDIFRGLERKKTKRQPEDPVKEKPRDFEMTVKLPDELDQCLPPSDKGELQSSDAAECLMMPDKSEASQ